MAKRRRKKRYTLSFVNLFLILILLGLLVYSGILLYNFLKENKVINSKNNKILIKKDHNNINNNNNEKEKQIIQEVVKQSVELLHNKEDQKDNNETSIKNSDNNVSEKITNQKYRTDKSSSEQKPFPEKPASTSDQNSANKNTSRETKTVLVKEIKETKKVEKYNLKNFYLYLLYVDSNGKLKFKKFLEPIKYTDSPVFAIISTLITYKKKGYINLIPEGTKLLGAWIRNNILYLNFNEKFLNNKNGFYSVKAQIYQIVNSAMQFPNIKGVKILINGKTRKYFSDEGFLLDIIFKKNENI